MDRKERRHAAVALFDGCGHTPVIATDGVVGIPVLNPYLSIMFATVYPGKPKESLTREQAVTAFTATAAYAELPKTAKGNWSRASC